MVGAWMIGHARVLDDTLSLANVSGLDIDNVSNGMKSVMTGNFHQVVLTRFKHKVFSFEAPWVVAQVAHFQSHVPCTQKVVHFIRCLKYEMVLVYLTFGTICLHVDLCIAIWVARNDRSDVTFEWSLYSDFGVCQDSFGTVSGDFCYAVNGGSGMCSDLIQKPGTCFASSRGCWLSVKKKKKEQ